MFAFFSRNRFSSQAAMTVGLILHDVDDLLLVDATRLAFADVLVTLLRVSHSGHRFLRLSAPMYQRISTATHNPLVFGDMQMIPQAQILLTARQAVMPLMNVSCLINVALSADVGPSSTVRTKSGGYSTGMSMSCIGHYAYMNRRLMPAGLTFDTFE